MIVERPLPWHRERRCAVDAIIIHYISAMYSKPKDPYCLDTCIDILNKEKLSYHYIITRDPSPSVIRLVDDTRKAFHAGYGNLFGRKDNVNDFSIGISLLAKPDDTFTFSQIEQLTFLVRQIRQTYAIPLNRIVGHDMVDPERKKDPGPKFPWLSFLERCSLDVVI